ncbi:hypothetical protein PUN28_010541 [Cardiocondyla obscurior]|uniref:Uncharacterized protein n=1 Tax=Cardiocondyla obscurior TaxID=286306 RepID=A0AAW2FGI0_9HYME
MFNECGRAVTRDLRATRVVPTFSLSLSLSFFPPRRSFLKAKREREEERRDHDVTFVTSVTKGERARDFMAGAIKPLRNGKNHRRVCLREKKKEEENSTLSDETRVCARCNTSAFELLHCGGGSLRSFR